MVTIYKTKLDDQFNLTCVRESVKAGDGRKSYSTPEMIVDLVNDVFDLKHEATEHTVLVGLDPKLHIKGLTKISVGTAKAALICPREAFQKALIMDASNIILIHNHPSGDATPSSEDVSVAHRMSEAGKVLGINFADNIIIAGNNFNSFKVNNMM